MTGMDFGPQDAGYQPQEPTPSYQEDMNPVDGGSSGSQNAQGQLQKWNGILQQVNQLMQQAQQLGIIQPPGQPQQQQNTGAGPQQMESAPQSQGQTPAQGQQNQQGPQTQNVDQAVNQAYQQLMQFVTLMQEELGEDATLDETQGYMVENEQGLKTVIRQQVEAQL